MPLANSRRAGARSWRALVATVAPENAMLAATYAKRPGNWCAGSPSQLHHEAQQRHKGVGLSACEQLCGRLACPCYQSRTADRECRVSPPGEFERPKKSGQGFDALAVQARGEGLELPALGLGLGLGLGVGSGLGLGLGLG